MSNNASKLHLIDREFTREQILFCRFAPASLQRFSELDIFSHTKSLKSARLNINSKLQLQVVFLDKKDNEILISRLTTHFGLKLVQSMP